MHRLRHLRMNVGKVRELSLLCKMLRKSIDLLFIFEGRAHRHLRKLIREVGCVHFALLNSWNKRCFHALSLDHVPVNTSEEWMLLDFDYALVAAANPQLWVVPQELLKEIVGFRTEGVGVFVLLEKLVLTCQDLFNPRANLMGLGWQLVLVFKRILATEHFEK